MKTILLILFLGCAGLTAQTPPAFPTFPPDTNTTTSATTNDAQKDGVTRALRDSIVDDPAGAPQTAPPVFPNPSGVTNPPGRRRFGLRGTNAPSAAASGTNSPVTGGNRAVAPGGANVRVPGVPGGLPTPGAGTNSLAGGAEEKVIPAGQINFPDIDLSQVLEVYAELVNRTVLHAQLPQVKISLKTQTPLTKSEAIQAFDSVLAMNSVTIINVGEKFVKAVPMATAGTVAAPFDTHKVEDLPEADQYVTHIVQLKYLKPSEIQPALQPLAQIPTSILPIESNNMLIIRDYAGNLKRMLELIAKLDVNLPMDYESEVIPIKYAQAQDIASALSSLGGGTGTSIGTRPGGGAGGNRGGFGSGLGSGGLGGNSLGGGGLNNGYNQQGGFGGVNNNGLGNGGLNTGTLGSTGANNRTSSFGDRLNSLVRRASAAGEFQVLGNTKIIADQRTNSLLVFASKQDLAMVKKIIAELDIVLPQVLIEAMIMEVSLDSSHSLGMSYLQTTPSTIGNSTTGIGALNNGTILNPSSFSTVGSNGVPSGFSYLANFGNDLSVTATAIANDSHINVLSRPRIQTSHGVPATIQVGQQVPIVSGTYFGGYSGAASSQYQEQFVGISLQVTPLINPDGLVVMDVVQNVQQLGPNYTIDGNPVPSTTQRSAQSTVSVRDRDTIILGGMISSTKNVSNAGIPLLKDIPGIGALFRSSSSDNLRDELIVLIRPTVLPTPEAAALAASRERERLPAVRAAEEEEHRDEVKRLKQYEKLHPLDTQP